jgi:hypothetical protein
MIIIPAIVFDVPRPAEIQRAPRGYRIRASGKSKIENRKLKMIKILIA